MPIQRSCASDEVVTSEIQKLIDDGLLVKLKSPWAFPLLLVKKKDGTDRVDIDYCKLNDVTKKDSYPLPRINNALDVLGDAKYFSAMDLISGYWQIDLSPEDQEKCPIIISRGLF